MLLSALRKTAPTAAFSAFALALVACGGASSDEPAAEPAAEANTTGALADMALGDQNAPVTIIEYASVTCPHCAAFHESIFPDIQKAYIETGKVKFVFREFPTAPANLSVAGSMLARCAADKGGMDAYFLVLDALFKTQRTWIYGDTRDELIKIASQAGMDEDGFQACVGRQELIDLINENVSEGAEKYEVNSTPSFIVGGQLRHFSTTEDFAAAIEEQLAKTENKE